MAPVDASRLDAAGRLRWNRGYDLVEQIMLHPRQETAGVARSLNLWTVSPGARGEIGASAVSCVDGT